MSSSHYKEYVRFISSHFIKDIFRLYVWNGEVALCFEQRLWTSSGLLGSRPGQVIDYGNVRRCITRIEMLTCCSKLYIILPCRNSLKTLLIFTVFWPAVSISLENTFMCKDLLQVWISMWFRNISSYCLVWGKTKQNQLYHWIKNQRFVAYYVVVI